ncbi:MAG: family 43 glycosylhydrolase [Pyrinomonadaceae bacterium]
MGKTRAIILQALLILLCWSNAPAQQQPGTYTNPVIAGDYPDPSIIRVGENYWATATTGGWSPSFPLLHSRDLINWRVVGAVFDQPPAWAKGDFWAPEITEDRGRFFVYYTARRDDGPKKTGTLCVAVATAPKPDGPYTDHGPLVCQIPELKNVGSIDAVFVRDERSEPYLVWKADGNDAEPDQPTSIFAQRLSEEGTKLVGKRKEILRNTAPWERHVTEGSYIVRRGGWFYHFYSGNACCGRGCDYALGVARARKLLGPWEKHPRNPILDQNDAWQCPGHGSIVTTPDGRDFMLYHAYRNRRDAFNIGREALLDEITWGADGWPTINAGRGPSVAAPLPLGVAPRAETEFFEGFTAALVGGPWQWPMFGTQAARVEPVPGGFLFLNSGAGAPAGDVTGAVVAQRTTTGDYVATTLVNAQGMGREARAGLSAYSWRGNAVGISVGGGKVFTWRREDGKERTVATVDAPAAPVVFLRMTATGGEEYRFASSVNGREWREVGGAVAGSHVEGARVALVASGAGAKFDYLKITPSRRVEKE